jgi:hypothetical protein
MPTQLLQPQQLLHLVLLLPRVPALQQQAWQYLAAAAAAVMQGSL